MGSRCLWDADSDNMAQDVFMNESLFCAAVGKDLKLSSTLFLTRHLCSFWSLLLLN
jgi:hypothetical protein